MVEAVDHMITELIARDNGHRAAYQAAGKDIDGYIDKLRRLAAAMKLADEMLSKPASRGAPGSAAAKEANAAVAEVKKAAKAKADAEKAAAKEAADAIKAAEREKAAAARATAKEADTIARAAVKAASERAAAERAASDAVIAAAEREAAARARLAAVAQRAVDRQITGLPQATGRGGATVPRETTGQRSIPAAVLNGRSIEQAVEEREINHILADDLSLRARLLAATGAEAAALRDQRLELSLINGYKRAGLADDEAALRIESDLAAIGRIRTAEAERQAVVIREQNRRDAAKAGAAVSLFIPTLVGGVSVHEISALNDEYIKLSNSLKIAGVSAGELDHVQAHLLATANRTGTDINALADLYRSAALASHDLGASQADLLKVSDAVANALRIGGRSSEEARGAILQLGHAFESGRVTAREFNSLALNLYPILQAVARGSDQYGGSVAKLRQALLDGDITSKVFFQNLLRGADDLERRAGHATLTTAQGFTALRNSLVVYFGEADKAQGVSAALGAALGVLSRNLDTLIPAIVAVGTALTVGYAARATEAALATKNLGGSLLSAFGGPIGLTISAVAIALGTFAVDANTAAENAAKTTAELSELQGEFAATSGGAIAAAGGVKGVGTDALGAIPRVNAFAGAVGNLADQLYRQARAARTARIESLQQRLTEGQKAEVELGNATPAGRAAQADDARAALRRGNVGAFIGGAYRDARGFFTNALSGGESDRDAVRAYQSKVQSNLLIERQIREARSAPITAADIPGGAPTTSLTPQAQKQLTKLRADVAGLEQLAGGATGARLDRIKKQIDVRNRKIADIEAGVTTGAANAAEGGGSRGRRGPSADTLSRRAEAARVRAVRDDRGFDVALRQATSAELSAQADLTDDPVARANVERERIRFAAAQTAKELATKGPKSANGTGDYTAAEVAQLQGINDRTKQFNLDKIDLGERRRIADDALSVERADLDNQRQALQARQGLADTVAARRKVARDLLDLDYRQRELELRAVLAPDSRATKAEKDIATERLRLLPGQKARDLDNVDRQNETAGQAYTRGLDTDRSEFIDSEKVKLLQGFNRELDDSVAKALHLHGIFGEIVGDLIDMALKQAVLKPLAHSLFGGGTDSGSASGGGIGGFFGAIISAVAGSAGGGGGKIPGFANGGTGIIRGRPGIDQSRLDLDGSPIAYVGDGERLTISNPNIAANNSRVSARGPASSTVVHAPQFNLSGAVVTAELYQDMQRISQQSIAAAAPHIARAGAEAAPQVSRRIETLGS